MWLIGGAAKNGDYEEHAKYKQQLDVLLETEDRAKQNIVQHEKVAAGVTHINAKSRAKNRSVEAAVGSKNRQSRLNNEDDFVRRPTKLSEYFDLGDTAAQPNSPR